MYKIFVTLGSQQFQFNRLLIAIDNFIKYNSDGYEAFAQIGYSSYVPKNFSSVTFLGREEFKKNIAEADILITHAGTGAIISGVTENKKVIAFSRLSKYKEHVDDHQIQILNTFIEKNYILGSKDTNDLAMLIKKCDDFSPSPFISNSKQFVEKLEEIIDE